MMDQRGIIWSLLLCLGVIIRFYLNLDTGLMHLGHYPELYNHSSDSYMVIKRIANFSKLILQPEDFINSTDPEERAYEFLRASTLENFLFTDQYYSNHEDLIASGQPVADPKRCKEKLTWIKHNIDKNRNYRTLKGHLGRDLTGYLDSFGQSEAGFFSGSASWMGSQELCERSTLNGGNIKTRYCMARYRLISWTKDEFLHPKPRIRIGLCLPEECDTHSYKYHSKVIDVLIKHQLNQYYRENMDIESMFCPPDPRSPLTHMSLGGYFFVFLLASWMIFVVLISILYERIFRAKKFLPCKNFGDSDNLEELTPYRGQDSPFVRLMESVTIRRSLKSFLSVGFRPVNQSKRCRYAPKVSFDSLAFIRCAMTLLIMAIHCTFHMMAYPKSVHSRVKVASSSYMIFLIGLSKFVDTFFIISGMLKTYNLLNKYSKDELANPRLWISTNISTLQRNLPPFLVIYWSLRLVVPYLGSGPWWDYRVDNLSVGSLCKNEPWWKSLLLFSSLDEPATSFCVVPAWYLTSYFQLAFLVPWITYIIVIIPNNLVRFGFFLFLTLLSIFNNMIKLASLTVIGPEAFSVVGGLFFNISERFQVIGYFDTLGRLNDVVAGCFVGYFLYKFKSGQLKEWPRWLRSRSMLALALSTIFIVLNFAVIGHFLFRSFGVHLQSMSSIAFLMLLVQYGWIISNSILLIHVTSIRTHTTFVRFASHSFWQVLNKLNLVIYLINYDVIQKTLQLHENAIPTGHYSDMWKAIGECLFITLPIALAIYFFIDAPLSNLDKVHKRNKASKRSQAREMSIKESLELRDQDNENGRMNLRA